MGSKSAETMSVFACDSWDATQPGTGRYLVTWRLDDSLSIIRNNNEGDAVHGSALHCRFRAGLMSQRKLDVGSMAKEMIMT